MSGDDESDDDRNICLVMTEMVLLAKGYRALVKQHGSEYTACPAPWRPARVSYLFETAAICDENMMQTTGKLASQA